MVDGKFRFGFKSSCCSCYVAMQLHFTDCCHIAFALEMIMPRAGILYTPGCQWTQAKLITLHYKVNL